MRQGIGHEALVLSLAYLTVDIAVVPDIFWRTVYPERNFKLIVSQRPVDFCRVVTADEATVLFVAFLAMVGHVDDDGILFLEPLHNLGYDRVVVEGGVIVMTQHLALGIGQFRALVFITACPEAGLLRAVTQLIVYMLSHQVEDGEVVLLLEVLQTVIIILQQSVVQVVELGVAMVKLKFAQFRVVQEETAAEVVNRLLCLWQEFVGDEGYVVACLAEHFWEERIVAPFAFLAYYMGREHVLENETGQVPAGYHIGKLGELARFLQGYLLWSGIHEIAVLLGMMAAEAFADNQYDVWRAVAAAVNLYLVGSMNELGNLMRSQLVGIDTELESVDWQIKYSMILLSQDMLYFAYRSTVHEFMVSHLVVPGGAASCDEDDEA